MVARTWQERSKFSKFAMKQRAWWAGFRMTVTLGFVHPQADSVSRDYLGWPWEATFATVQTPRHA